MEVGFDAEALAHTGLVDELPTLAAVELHDLGVLDALAQVLVDGADHGPAHAVVVAGDAGRGSQAVVGLLLDHRPDGDAEGAQTVFQERELRQQLRGHALTRLVPDPQLVAERLDDVVGGHAHVGRALFQHHQHGAQHTPGGGHLHAVGIEV